MDSYKIDLEPYCEDCEGFEVKVVEDCSFYTTDGYDQRKVILRDITCKHTNKCKQMYRHLKRVEKEKAE